MRNIIERQRNLIDFTLSSLARRKGKNIALFLAYVLIVFLLASVILFTHALKTEASLVLRNAPEIVVQRMEAGRQDMVPVRYIDVLRTIRGVQEARGRLWGYYYDPVTGANYTSAAAAEPQAEVARKAADLSSEVSRLVGLGRASNEDLRVASTVLDSVRDQLRHILRG